LKSSLEAEVDLVVPNGTGDSTEVLDLLQREGRFPRSPFEDLTRSHNNSIEHFLKTLFIVSDASLTDEGSLGTTSPEWLYTGSVSITGAFGSLHLPPR